MEDQTSLAEVEPASRVGTIIRGKWRVDSLVGSGGMASVYAATHRNGQTAALKILHMSLANETSVRDRFLREGYVANSVNHPGVVEVLDDDETDEGAPFLIMELLIGQTLSRRWKRLNRRMPIPEALRIATPVLDCLAACHAASVIHRDLKPPNIFLTEDGRVKILDFGVAQLRDASTEKTRTGTALGTPYYMSPEQAMGLVDQLDGRADLFSIGAILHAMITGQRIHSARTENEALILAATTPVPSVARVDANLPIEVIKLIDKSLAWDRRNRYDDALQMREAVQMVLATVEGHDPSVVEVIQGQDQGQQPVSLREPRWEQEAPAPISKPVFERVRPAEEPGRVVAQVPEAIEEVADEDDLRVQELRDLFRHIERFLPTVRQLKWGHPATERAFKTVFDAFTVALDENPDLISLKIRPYSFLGLGQTVWEPAAPFDTVPYNMFASGMRTFAILRGISLDEFRSALALMLVDPGQELPPEDDMVSAFWDLGLRHVVFETTDPFTDGDAGQREAFVDEADVLEDLAAQASAARTNLIEAKAMAVSTDGSALAGGGGPSPMAVEKTVQVAFASQLEVTREQWSERYIDVLVEGLKDALKRGDSQIVFGALRKSASDVIVADRLEVALDLHRAIVDKLRVRGGQFGDAVGDLTDSMFGGDTLRIFLDRIINKAELARGLEPVLTHLSSNELSVVLSALQRTLPVAIRSQLLEYVKRNLVGQEDVLAESVAGLEPGVVFPVLEMLVQAGTSKAKETIESLTKSKDIAVRIEATILSAHSPDDVERQLTALINDSSLGVRIASLRAIGRHNVKRILPAVTRRINVAAFHSLVPEERRELFSTIIFLAPERGEEIALDIAKRGGLFSNEAREASRVAAIDALGAASKSSVVLQELQKIAQARWTTSDSLRSRAMEAAAQVEARISSGRSETSGGGLK